jgi:hypothetical protein
MCLCLANLSGPCLAAHETEPNDIAALANSVTVDGDAMVGQIAPAGDADWYCFAATAGTAYMLVTSGAGDTDMDTVLELTDTDGLTWLASDDDNGPDLYSAFAWQCPVSGVYYATVMGCESTDVGDYRLEIYSISGDAYESDDTMGTATTITTDGTGQDHTLYPSGDLDWLKFSATAGTAYSIGTSQTGPPGSTDTHLFLYDATATQLRESDDLVYGDDLYSRIDWTCPADGTYWILVRISTFYTDPTPWMGPYTISVSGGGGGAAATTLVADDVSGNVGQTVQLSATLSSGGDPLAGKTVHFEVDGIDAGSGTTNASGVAGVAYTIPGLGDRAVTAGFAGDAAYDPSSDGATLTVTNSVSGIGLFLSRSEIASGESTTATVVDAGGRIITGACNLFIQFGAGGWWDGAEYTGAKAGTWTVTATYGPLGDTKPLTVTHGVACGVDISPDCSTITTAGTQTYAVTAADAQDNVWTPGAADITWTHDGGGAFAGSTYTPDAGDAGGIVDIYATVDGVDSDHAALAVNADSGAGLTLAWDKDDRNFYLCQNPANPQSADVAGLIPAANGTYTVNGVSVTVWGSAGNRAVTINNSHHVVNSLQVRWFVRGGVVQCAFMYSTVCGGLKTATYRAPTTYVDGEYRLGFWGLTHRLDAADPSSITYGALQQ